MTFSFAIKAARGGAVELAAAQCCPLKLITVDAEAIVEGSRRLF
jgi:hypothetical protein